MVDGVWRDKDGGLMNIMNLVGFVSAYFDCWSVQLIISYQLCCILHLLFEIFAFVNSRNRLMFEHVSKVCPDLL